MPLPLIVPAVAPELIDHPDGINEAAEREKVEDQPRLLTEPFLFADQHGQHPEHARSGNDQPRTAALFPQTVVPVHASCSCAFSTRRLRRRAWKTRSRRRRPEPW